MQGMSRASTIMLLGVLVLLAPFSGFPMALRALFEFVFGVVVFSIGLSMRLHAVRRAHEATIAAPETLGESIKVSDAVSP